MRAGWVTVEFTGTQPTILRGASGVRYTFLPNRPAAIDRQDLEAMLQTQLFKLQVTT